MGAVKRAYRSPRRKEQAEATRHAILEAALALFMEQGFSGTSIREVAERADVSEQTVYKAFGDKVGLLYHAGLEYIETGGGGAEAEFLAAVQLLLYAGGVVTIVVFAIVVTERLVGERLSHTNRGVAAGAVVSLVLVGFVVSMIAGRPLATTRPPLTGDLTRTLGEAVLTRFVLPFELLAVLMLAAMLGAVYFARPEE